MALDTTAADGILKEFYLPAVREQINNAIPFLTQINKNTEDVEGEEGILSLHVTRNAGIGARAEGGTLPTAGAQGYVKARVPFRTQTGRIKVTIQAIKALASNRSSFERAVDSEMKRIVNDLKRDVNRQLWGTSDGVIASCSTTTSTTTVNLASTTTDTQLRQLEVGMVVDVVTFSSGTATAVSSGSGLTISAVDTANKTITVSAAISCGTSDRVVRSGSGGGPTTTQKELTGMQTIVDSSGTLFSVDPTSYPSWKSTETAVSGLPTAQVFEKAIDDVNIAGGSDLDQFWTTHGVTRQFAATEQAAKRYVNTVDVKAGYKGIEVSSGGQSAVLMRDRDVPDDAAAGASGLAFGVDTAHFQKFEWCDWEWLEDPGILRQVTDQLAYEATIYSMFELATDKRNAAVKLSGLTAA